MKIKKCIKKAMKYSKTTTAMVIGLIFIALIILIYQTNSSYNENNKNKLLQSKIGSFGKSDIKLAIYINGTIADRFPTEDEGKSFEKAECTNGAIGAWNAIKWEFNISSLTKPTECNIYFKEGATLAKAIIKDNGGLAAIEENGTPDYTQTKDTNFYAANDNYGTSYYYRGAMKNNNIIFAGYQWKIIRINGDGSVRLIYNGECADNICINNFNTTGANTHIGLYKYNTTANDNRYIGFMYGETCTSYETCHENVIKSNALIQLETWYEANLLNKDDGAWHQKVADNVFCNDRRIVSGTGAAAKTTVYAGKDRIINATPSLFCQTKNDSFTVTETDSTNGSLTYPVGLVTADEVMMAGQGYYSKHGYASGNYLESEKAGDKAMTMTPYNHGAHGCNHVRTGATIWIFRTALFFHTTTCSGGCANSILNTTAIAIRPVINISGDVKIVENGDGTSGNPYIVLK